MKFVDIPSVTTYGEVLSNNYSLSATQYKKFSIKNKNVLTVKDFLSRDLCNADLGQEVGSENYLDGAPNHFIKAGALQPYSYLLDIDKESVKDITPKCFIQKKTVKLFEGDVLVSKDSNVGEVVILDKNYPNSMLSGALYRLPIKDHKYYLLAMMKSLLFREQIDYMVPRGSTIRHGKTMFLDVKIPMPNTNEVQVIRYVELLTQAIVSKEIEIKKKYSVAQHLLDEEIKNNQKNLSEYVYVQPTISDIINYNRIDSALYSCQYKKNLHLINNYVNGVIKLEDFVKEPVRGQNLQISNIGTSIYSDTYHRGFYTLVRPTNISEYGTVTEYEYIGNKNELLLLEPGDIVFGAEATFRSFVIVDKFDNLITNIHGVIFPQKNNNVTDGIVLKLLFDYYREIGILRACAVGGNGGSLAIKYFKLLRFPNFPSDFREKIASMYYSKYGKYDSSKCTINDFEEYDEQYNKCAGIYELDKSKRYLELKLQKAIEDISNDVTLKVEF